MPPPVESTLLGVLVLSMVHLFIGSLRFIDVIPRSRWLSLAGGASVAYVFLHIIPELSLGQQLFASSSLWVVEFRGHIYMVALAGLVTYYALERIVRTSRRRATEAGTDRPSASVYQINITSFMAYNILTGYLLVHRIVTGALSLVIFTTAFAFHFMVVDYGLLKDHRGDYDRSGRYLLIAALIVGWAVGYTYTLHELGLAIMTAFLGGGVILNVLKEELPEDRMGRILPFITGAFGYALLLVFL